MLSYHSSRLLIIILYVIFLFTWKNPSLKILEVILRRTKRHFLRCGQVFQGTVFNCIFFSFELPSSPPNFLFMQLLLLYISFWEIYGWAQYNGRNFCFENIFWTLCYYDSTRQADGQHNTTETIYRFFCLIEVLTTDEPICYQRIVVSWLSAYYLSNCR